MTLFPQDQLDDLQPVGQLGAASNEFYTPKAIREHLPHIDLDPCAAPSQLLQASERFVGLHGQDGLSLSWDGPRRHGSRIAFCNPPYNRREDGQSNLALWTARCRKAAESHEADLVIALIPARTSESYWREHIFGVADAVGLVHGRVRFENAAGVPHKDGGTFASALVMWTCPATSSYLYDADEKASRFAQITSRLVWWFDARNQWIGLGEPEV